jgi:hypothetical protein
MRGRAGADRYGEVFASTCFHPLGLNLLYTTPQPVVGKSTLGFTEDFRQPIGFFWSRWHFPVNLQQEIRSCCMP